MTTEPNIDLSASAQVEPVDAPSQSGLDALLAAQRAAYQVEPMPSAALRIERLKRLKRLLLDNKTENPRQAANHKGGA